MSWHRLSGAQAQWRNSSSSPSSTFRCMSRTCRMMASSQAIQYVRITYRLLRTKSYGFKHYALEMIIAVGYWVRSARGTQLRQWATATLAEYLN